MAWPIPAEWAVLAALAAIAALYIALPRREDSRADLASEALADDLRAQRDELVAALRDLDEDVEAGRMAADDRRRGRQEIGERLRDVMEHLRVPERP